MLNFYQLFIQKLNSYLFLLVSLTLTFPSEVSRTIWTVWLITWALEFRFCKKSNFSFNRHKLPIALFGSVFIWLLITSFWAADITQHGRGLERYISLIATPLVALFGVNKYYSIKKNIIAFCIGSFISLILYLYGMYLLYNYNYFLNGLYPPLYSGIPNFTFTSGTSSSLIHRFFLCCFLILFMTFFYFNRKEVNSYIGNFRSKVMIGLLAITTIFTIYYTGSRASIIALALIIGLMTFFWMSKKSWRNVGYAGLAIIIAISVALVLKHPRMQTVTIANSLNTAAESINADSEPRFFVLNASIRNMSDYLLFGKGAGYSSIHIEKQFRDLNYPEHFIAYKFHAHNQFLETLMEGGIIALILMLAALIATSLCSTQKNRELAIIYAIFLVFCFIFDSLIRSSNGIILLCYFNLLLLWMNDDKAHRHQLIN